MARALVIDDEEGLRATVVRGLSTIPNLEIAEAGNMTQAAASLDEAPPDIVLADIDLPDRSGIEILGELGKRSLRVPVIFISAYLKAYRPQIPHSPLITVLAKPVSIQVVVDRVRSLLGDDSAHRPNESSAPFGADDFIQIACMGRHSVEISVAPNGRIAVVDGELWFAEMDAATGETAVADILFRSAGAVRCHALEPPPPTRNITRHWEHVLLDAAKTADEDEASPPRELDADEQLFRQAWETGIDALLARQHAEAYEAFRRAAVVRPDDEKVQANLRRLRDMGFGKDPTNEPEET